MMRKILIYASESTKILDHSHDSTETLYSRTDPTRSKGSLGRDIQRPNPPSFLCKTSVFPSSSVRHRVFLTMTRRLSGVTRPRRRLRRREEGRVPRKKSKILRTRSIHKSRVPGPKTSYRNCDTRFSSFYRI